MDIKLKDAKELMGDKVGRPKLDKEKLKDKRYTVRLDDRLNLKVAKLANELDMTPSEVFRKLLDDYEV